jgi:hypothetical protein
MAVGKSAEQQIGFPGAPVPGTESQPFSANLDAILVHSRYLTETDMGILPSLS